MWGGWTHTQIAQDALLMGCSEAQLLAALHALIDALHNPYGAARHEACHRG